MTGGCVAEGRPAIPAQMERDVLIEAGYRCAIPRCGQTEITIDHIDDYAKVKEHRFDNLIVLCANCHQRKTQGKIDRKALRQIKANLSIVSGRYGDMERRVLQMLANAPAADCIDLPGGLQIFFHYLLSDGMLLYGGMAPGATQIQGVNTYDRYILTQKGREFVDHWIRAEPLG